MPFSPNYFRFRLNFAVSADCGDFSLLANIAGSFISFISRISSKACRQFPHLLLSALCRRHSHNALEDSGK